MKTNNKVKVIDALLSKMNKWTSLSNILRLDIERNEAKRKRKPK